LNGSPTKPQQVSLPSPTGTPAPVNPAAVATALPMPTKTTAAAAPSTPSTKKAAKAAPPRPVVEDKMDVDQVSSIAVPQVTPIKAAPITTTVIAPDGTPISTSTKPPGDLTFVPEAAPLISFSC
jgi:hypothetical protein